MSHLLEKVGKLQGGKQRYYSKNWEKICQRPTYFRLDFKWYKIRPSTISISAWESLTLTTC